MGTDSIAQVEESTQLPPQDIRVSRFGMEGNENEVLNNLGWQELISQGKVSGLQLGVLDNAKQIALHYPEMAGTLEEIDQLKKDIDQAKNNREGWIYDNAQSSFDHFCSQASADQTFQAMTSLAIEAMIESGKLVENYPSLSNPNLVKTYYPKGQSLADLNSKEAFGGRPANFLNIIGKALDEKEKQKLQMDIADQITQIDPLHIGLILKAQNDKFYTVTEEGQTFVVRHRRVASKVEDQEVDIRTLDNQDQIKEARILLQEDPSERQRQAYKIKQERNALINDGETMKRIPLPMSEKDQFPLLPSQF